MEETLGKRISSGRKKLSLTQDQLAEKLGVTAQAVSKWENDLSCPDISMLPRLAEIFGITTDQLLGLKQETRLPVHEGSLEAMSEDTLEERTAKNHYRPRNRGGLWFAMTVLIIGCLWLTAVVFELDVSLWQITWPVCFMMFGLRGIRRRVSFFRIGCLIFGLYFLAEHLGLLPSQMSHAGLILPVCLILFGISLLADILRSPQRSVLHFHHGTSHGHDMIINGNRFDYSSSFGEHIQTVKMNALSKGSISTSFGEYVVDLSGVKEFDTNCHVEINCSFGELCIRLPKRCLAEITSSTAFGTVETNGGSDPDAASAIHLDISVNFGEVTVSYI